MITDPSYEKAARSRAGVQVAVWNESSSWLGPLREYARISGAIRPGLRTELIETTPDTAERRLQFLGWEVESLVIKHRSHFKSAIDLLNHIFFRELEFHLSSPAHAQKNEADSALLEYVLARREGPTTLVSILYTWMAEAVARVYADESDFSRVELVHATPGAVVRVIAKEDRGEVWLLDLAKQGQRVDKDEWSIWCAALPSDGFARMTFAQGLVRSLIELFKLLEKLPAVSIDMLSAQLFVLDQIMVLQPSETSRWAERAMLNTRRGDRTSALDDLKRFFAFHERTTAPASLVSLFDDLSTELR